MRLRRSTGRLTCARLRRAPAFHLTKKARVVGWLKVGVEPTRIGEQPHGRAGEVDGLASEFGLRLIKASPIRRETEEADAARLEAFDE